MLQPLGKGPKFRCGQLDQRRLELRRLKLCAPEPVPGLVAIRIGAAHRHKAIPASKRGESYLQEGRHQIRPNELQIG